MAPLVGLLVTKVISLYLLAECDSAYVYISLLLRHWYEIMALYYVKSILTEISDSRQDRGVLQKNNKFFEHMGHATDVMIRREI